MLHFVHREIWQCSNVLDDHGFDSGFMIAMYSFVPMGFQAWIDFIRVGRASTFSKFGHVGGWFTVG